MIQTVLHGQAQGELEEELLEKREVEEVTLLPELEEVNQREVLVEVDLDKVEMLLQVSLVQEAVEDIMVVDMDNQDIVQAEEALVTLEELLEVL